MMWGYGMWWGSLIWLILFGGIAWALIANNRSTQTSRPNALEILEGRLARSEIDTETYRTTRNELERN